MSILERSALPPAPVADRSTLPSAPAADRSTLPPAPAADGNPPSGRLRVITAGGVDNIEARLGASGFDVVAVAQTEDALIDAVSVDEPDAIIVEADLCASLEHVRDLAPDAVLIVIGDHTPAGALGRIERGVSGTTMAGLLHALVANGVGAAAPWGLVPAFGPRSALQVPERISVWLLSEKADLVRAYVVNAFRDHAELVTAATTAAVTVSAGLVLTMSAARSNEPPHVRPERVHGVAPAVERSPQQPVVVVSPTTPIPAYVPFGKDGEPGDRPGPDRGESGNHGRYLVNAGDVYGEAGVDPSEAVDPAEAGVDPSEAGIDPSEAVDPAEAGVDPSEAGIDPSEAVDPAEAGVDPGQAGVDHGENANVDKGKAGDDHGENANVDKGKAGDDHGDAGDDHGEGGDVHGENANDNYGENESDDDVLDPNVSDGDVLGDGGESQV
jgi:hypothetical protein